MAKNNYAYSLLIGAEIDDNKLNEEFKRVQTYLKNSKNTNIEIKTLFNSKDLEKQLVNVRDLLDKINGEKIGEVGTFKIGDKFIEVQKTIKGTIQNVELLQQSMQRLNEGVKPLDSIEKKISSLKEKLNQIKISDGIIINQTDLSNMDNALKKIEEIVSTTKDLQKESTTKYNNIKYLEKELDTSREINQVLHEKLDIEKEIKKYSSSSKRSENVLKDLKSNESLLNKEANDATLKRELEIRKSLSDNLKSQAIYKDRLVESNSQLEVSKQKLEEVSQKFDTISKKAKLDYTDTGIKKTCDELIELRDRINQIPEEISNLNTEKDRLIKGMEDGFNKISNSSKNYKTELKDLTNQLKEQYTEANKLQKSLNDAYKSDNTVGISKFTNQLKELDKQIKSTKSSITKLTGDSGIQKDLSSKLGSSYKESKNNQKYSEQKAQIDKLIYSLNELESVQKKISQLEGQNSNSHQNELQYLKERRSAIEENISSLKQNSTVLEDEYSKRIKEIESTIKIINLKKQDKDITDSQKATLSEYNKELKELGTLKEKQYKLEQKMLTQNSENSDINNTLLNEYKSQISASEEKLNTLKDTVKNTEIADTMTEAYSDSEKKLRIAQLEAAASGEKQNSIIGNISEGMDQAIKRSIEYATSMGIIVKAIEALRASVDIIYELNKSMTDVQMVTGSTASEMGEMAEHYSQMAQDLGSTTDQIAAGASEWLRQGKTIAETNELIKQGAILARVGAIEDSESVEKLTSTINGYSMAVEEASHIVDAYSAVDLEAATSVAELAEAMSRTANMANDLGISFDTMNGYIGAVSEATRRSASTIGEAFKTLLSRFTNVKVGKFVSDEDAKELNDISKALNKIGITLIDNNNQWRNMEVVFGEIHDKWGSLNDLEKNAVSTAVAGARQAEIWRSFMNNFDRAIELGEVSMNSTGMAVEKFSVYLESLEAKTNQFKASWQELVYNPETVKFLGDIIDLGKNLITVLDDLISNPLSRFIIQTAALSAGLVFLGKVIKQLGTFTGISALFTGLSTTFQSVATNATSLSSAITILKGSTAAMTLGISLAIPIIFSLISAINEWIVTTDESIDKTKELTSAWKKSIQDLEETGAQLSEVNSRLKELNEAEKTTLVEEAEIEKLKVTKKLLEEQLKLQQEINTESHKKATNSAKKTLGKISGNESDRKAGSSGISAAISTQFDEYGKIISQSLNLAQAMDNLSTISYQNIQYVTGALEELNKQLELGVISQQEYDTIFSYITEDLSSLNEQALEYLGILQDQIDSGNKDAIPMFEEFSKVWGNLRKEIDPATYSLEKFNEIMSSDSVQKYQEELISLANSGKLNEDTIRSYGDLSEQLKEAGISTEDFSNTLVKNQEELEKNSEEAVKATLSFKEFTSSIEGFKGAKDAFEEANSDIAEFGNISIETAQKISEAYPEMDAALGEYVLGLRSAQSVISEMEIYYESDRQAYYDSIIAKVGDNELWLKSIEVDGKNIIDYLNKQYNLDIKNNQSYNEVKNQINSESAKISVETYDQLNLLLEETYKNDKNKYVEYMEAKRIGQAAVLQFMLANANDFTNKVNAKLDEAIAKSLQVGNSLGILKAKLNKATTNTFASSIISIMGMAKNQIDNAANAARDLDRITTSNLDSSLEGLVSTLDDVSSSAKDAENAMDKLVDITVKMLKQNANNRKKALQDDLAEEKEAYQKRKKLLKDEYDEKKKAQQKDYERRKKLIEDQYEQEKEAIENARDAEIDGIEDRIDAYEKLIQSKLDALDKDEDEHDYQKEAAERLEEIAELQNSINDLKDDDSFASIKKRLELEAQLKEKQADFDEFQHDRGVELSKEALEAELDRYKEQMEAQKEAAEKGYEAELKALEKKYDAEKEALDAWNESQKESLDNWYKYQEESMDADFERTQKNYEKRIAALDDYLSKEGKIRQEAMNLIQNKSEELYKMLLEYNRLYGDGVDSTIDDIIKKAYSATNSINGMQASVANGFNGINNAIGFSMSSVNKLGNTMYNTMSNIINIVGSTIDKIHSFGRSLENTVSLATSVLNKTTSNKSSSSSSKKKTPVYHDGGYVDIAPSSNWESTLYKGIQDGLKPNEILAKLEKGEFVLTKSQQEDMAELVYRGSKNKSYSIESGIDIGTVMSVVVQGNLDDKVIPQLKNQSNVLIEKLNNTMTQRGNRRNAKCSVI